MNIDDFIACSRQMDGQEIREREPWNTRATADAIRHFAYGISDDNPLWLDPDYASHSRHGRIAAPPAFLTSVLYPVLHGAPVTVSLTSLIGELEFEWFHPVLEGDELRASAKQTGVGDFTARDGRRSVHILSETTYWNSRDEIVARARCTLIRRAQEATELLLDRPVHRYTEQERDRIRRAIEGEKRSGSEPVLTANPDVGFELPRLVRGPLTIGDLISWQAAIGPSYRAGSLGYRDAVAAPHSAVVNPITGWPAKNSQQHEDFNLASQRGMPAPFDNGVMRFAWVTPLLTNWIGDSGFLRRLGIQLLAPNLYGDATTYGAVVTGKQDDAITLKISGTNQLGETTTTGRAEVVLDPRQVMVQGASTLPAGLFERQASETPDALALVVGSREWTYDELNRQSNRLGRHLQSQGIRPGSLVGIRLPRSGDFVVAILAILKTGAGYVPLDPTYPSERLDLMRTVSRPALVIDGEVDLPPEDDNLDVRADAAAPAYVMFTSGSTGEPKGAVISHRALASYLKSIHEPLGTRPGDTCLHTASFSFSASVRQTLLPLTAGASLVVASDRQQVDPQALLQLMKDRAVTVWDTVPSVWRNAMDVLERLPAAARTQLLDNQLRQILLTGEALPWAFPSKWRSEIGHPARIVNLYSQTETAGTVAIFPLPGGDLPRQGIVPLGRPTADVQIRLRANGEIYVTGRLADGYLGGDRFEGYLTGDLARLNDGILEFTGRADGRLKVRGFRVEPREIEAALRDHPSVADAAVTARQNGSGQTELAAAVVPAGVDSRPSHTLPNGLRVAHQNPHETNFTYRHIFEDQTYLRHGITFNDGDVIFDIGANIGLFALFTSLVCNNPKLFCFEPNPGVHETLRANVERYRLNAQLYECALADHSGDGEFTSFPEFSILSGRYADPDREKLLVKAYMDNQPAMAPLAGHADELLERRLRPEGITVPQRTLSSVMREAGVERIHLLKINAEKSEVDILRGIEDADWERIDQIVIKADQIEDLHILSQTLEQRGFEFVVHQEEVLKGTTLHTICAILRSSGRTLIAAQRNGDHVRAIPDASRLLRRFLKERLPDYMVPARIQMVDALPRTPSGKLNIGVLSGPPKPQSPPGSFEETITAVWREVLEVDDFGNDDDFFALGGNSMTAVQAISRLNETLGTNLALAVLIDAPTVRQLAALINDNKPSATTSLVPIQPRGSNAPLFCIHAIEGDVLFYRDLAQRLGPDQPVYALQSLGLDGTCRPTRTVPEMAAHYIDEIKAVQAHGPYRLSGYCFGAYVGLEIAAQLEARGEEVSLLLNFNTDGEWRTISSPREAAVFHWRSLVQQPPGQRINYLLGRVRFRATRSRDRLAALAASAFLRAGSTVPAPLRKPYVREYNFRASRDFVARPFSGRLLFFQGAGERFHDPKRFWGPLAPRGIEIHSVPGRQDEVLGEPNVAAVADHLRAALRNASSDHGAPETSAPAPHG